MILNYTNNLIKEVKFHNSDKGKTPKEGCKDCGCDDNIKLSITTSSVKDFNSKRKKLLDAWKKHFKSLGTFDWDKDNKDGLL